MSKYLKDTFPIMLNIYKDKYLADLLNSSTRQIDYFISDKTKLVRETFRLKKMEFQKELLTFQLMNIKHS